MQALQGGNISLKSRAEASSRPCGGARPLRCSPGVPIPRCSPSCLSLLQIEGGRAAPSTSSLLDSSHQPLPPLPPAGACRQCTISRELPAACLAGLPAMHWHCTAGTWASRRPTMGSRWANSGIHHSPRKERGSFWPTLVHVGCTSVCKCLAAAVLARPDLWQLC